MTFTEILDVLDGVQRVLDGTVYYMLGKSLVHGLEQCYQILQKWDHQIPFLPVQTGQIQCWTGSLWVRLPWGAMEWWCRVGEFSTRARQSMSVFTHEVVSNVKVFDSPVAFCVLCE